jgi:hypothetical protein
VAAIWTNVLHPTAVRSSQASVALPIEHGISFAAKKCMSFSNPFR